MLRDFADRMLLKITAMDDPADLPGVERAVRTAAAIERIYSRCDRAEAHVPDPKKLEAERARHTIAAIEARVHLAGTLEWGDKRSKGLGKWWDAADTSAKTPPPPPPPVIQPAPPVTSEVRATAVPEIRPVAASGDTMAGGTVTIIDMTDAILKARADLGLEDLSEAELAEMTQAFPPSPCGAARWTPRGDMADTPDPDFAPRIRRFDDEWPPP